MDRQRLTTELQTARDELQRLRDERAKLTPGDRDGGARFRGLIATANADLADIERELADFDATEAGEARKAERALGRAAAAAAIKATDDSTKLWATLQKQLADARATAAELKALGEQTAQNVVAALAAQGTGSAERNTTSLLVPRAAGSDTMTVQALSESLKVLIDAVPGSFRVTSEFIQPVHFAFSFATSGPRPTMLDARARAAETLRDSLKDVCAEPRPVARTSWENPINLADRKRAA